MKDLSSGRSGIHRLQNIEETVRSNLCTGCGTCVGMCPRNAIIMNKDDKKGIYIPQKISERCVSCKICSEVCPGSSVDFRRLNLAIFGKEPKDLLLGNYLGVFSGHATDYNIRYDSTSGGIVTALLVFALEERIINGALVTSMQSENPMEPRVFIAKSKEEVISASKSKYCPVPLNVALREILADASKDKRYAIVGLPCHIHGIRKAEMLNRELANRILLHIGLFCSFEHTFWGTLYLLWKMSLKKEEITRLTYRGKGWMGGMTIDLKDGKRRFYPYLGYNNIWRSFFVPMRCTLCVDQCSELADISCGEIWLPEFMGDKIGTSAIVCRTKIGAEILQMASTHGLVQLKKVEREKLIESQRDQLILKKSFLSTRIYLFRLLHRKTPLYNLELSPTSFAGLLHSLALYAQVYLSSKQCFLPLLTPLAVLLQRMRAIYALSEGAVTKVSP